MIEKVFDFRVGYLLFQESGDCVIILFLIYEWL